MDEFTSAGILDFDDPDPEDVPLEPSAPVPDPYQAEPAPAAPPPPAPAVAPPPPPVMQPMATPAPVVLAPTTDPMARQAAGAQLLWVGVGMVAGAALLGTWGALGGASLTGALRNLFRARRLWQTERSEATRNATIGVVGLGLAGFSVYSALQRREK